VKKIVEVMMNNNIEIQPLEQPIEVIFEQYKCKACKKNSYINVEDKQREFVTCLLCGGESKSRRQFQISIIGIGEYETREI
jgi:hypothetical protein